MTTITPNARPLPDASVQMRVLPLVVEGGLTGARIAHAAGEYHQTVERIPEAMCLEEVEFPDLTTAYRVMREAQGATAAVLARIQVGPRR